MKKTEPSPPLDFQHGQSMVPFPFIADISAKSAVPQRHIYDIPLLHRRYIANAVGIETIVPLQFPAALYFFQEVIMA